MHMMRKSRGVLG
jgi:hypothetical protein